MRGEGQDTNFAPWVSRICNEKNELDLGDRGRHRARKDHVAGRAQGIIYGPTPSSLHLCCHWELLILIVYQSADSFLPAHTVFILFIPSVCLFIYFLVIQCRPGQGYLATMGEGIVSRIVTAIRIRFDCPRWTIELFMYNLEFSYFLFTPLLFGHSV